MEQVLDKNFLASLERSINIERLRGCYGLGKCELDYGCMEGELDENDSSRAGRVRAGHDQEEAQNCRGYASIPPQW